MKAQPMILTKSGYKKCVVNEATHLQFTVPSDQELIQILPVILKGNRQNTGSWTWNGDTNSPTLKPSVLITFDGFRCHSFITDGHARFLNDCSHSSAGKTIELPEIEE